MSRVKDLKEDYMVIRNITTWGDTTTFDLEVESFMGILEIPKMKVRCDLGKGIPCEGHLGYKLIYPKGIKMSKRYEVNIVNKLIHEGYIKGPLDGKDEVNLEWRSPKFKKSESDRVRVVYQFKDFEPVIGLNNFRQFVRDKGYELSDYQISNLLSGKISGVIKRKYPDLSPSDFKRLSNK